MISIFRILPADFLGYRVINDDCVQGDYSTEATGEAVAEILLRLFMSLGRTPAELQSDNGPQFTSAWCMC